MAHPRILSIIADYWLIFHGTSKLGGAGAPVGSSVVLSWSVEPRAP